MPQRVMNEWVIIIAIPPAITSVNSVYLAREQLGYDVYDGAWTDAGTFESYLLANQMMAPLPTT